MSDSTLPTSDVTSSTPPSPSSERNVLTFESLLTGAGLSDADRTVVFSCQRTIGASAAVGGAITGGIIYSVLRTHKTPLRWPLIITSALWGATVGGMIASKVSALPRLLELPNASPIKKQLLTVVAMHNPNIARESITTSRAPPINRSV